MEGTSRNDWRCRNSMGGGQRPGRDRERRGTTSYGRWEEAMTRLDDGAGDAEIAWDEAIGGCGEMEGTSRNDWRCRNSMGGGQRLGRDRERRGTTSYGRWEEAMTRLDDGAGDAEIAWDEEAMRVRRDRRERRGTTSCANGGAGLCGAGGGQILWEEGTEQERG